MCLAGTRLLPAQAVPATREYPPQEYYLAFQLVRQGDYVKGAQAFRSAARSGIRTTDGAWIDAVCYHAMIGECFYQMGDLQRALEQFTNAETLLVAHGNWMLRVDFPPVIEARNAGPRTPIAWGTSSRRTQAGRFPTRYPILQGRADVENVLRAGGVLAQQEFFLINAHEVVRCGALAIRRRAEILGQTSPHDPLHARLLELLATRPTQPNHWSGAWIDALLGMTYSAMGRIPEGISDLSKSLQVGGQFDHPVTPIALLQLGSLAFRQGQFDQAAAFYLEATISGAWFEQHDVMEEAFRGAVACHLARGASGGAAFLEPAVAWAKRERVPLLEVSLLTSQAHVLAELQENAAATAALEAARRAATRSEMSKGAAGARMQYVLALSAFQTGNLAAGENAWQNVLGYLAHPQRPASLRLFEIGLADALATSGRVTPRVASDLYSQVLREPTLADWSTNLLESLAVAATPQLAAHEHWLAVAIERGEPEKVLEISDRIRRLRFTQTLPLGGRLLALRWMLEAPQESLHDKLVLARQDLLTRYPKYAEASRRATQLQQEIAKLPLIPEDAVAVKKHQQSYTELASLSQGQELMLRAIALRREATELVAPPILDLAQVQGRLTPKQAVLAFLLTSQNQLHGCFVKRGELHVWRIEAANPLGKLLTELLKQMGQLDRNTPVEWELLRGEAWRTPAGDLAAKLLGDLKPAAWQGVEELIVVPDRWLWYVPFEALPLRPEETSPLLGKTAVRYVPTVSWVNSDRRPASPSPEVCLVLGKSLTPDAATQANGLANALRNTAGRVEQFTGTLPAPSGLLAWRSPRVVVLDDLDPLGKGAYGWAPYGVDQDKPLGTLDSWLSLPWGAPEQILLPEFHSVAETALRRAPTGDELFLSACGLLAAGSRTVVLSRWRTGGATSLELAREFVQEAPYGEAAPAWRRSVQLLWEKDLDVAREPRLKVGTADSPLRGSHPFFWAGYALIDTGVAPAAARK